MNDGASNNKQRIDDLTKELSRLEIRKRVIVDELISLKERTTSEVHNERARSAVQSDTSSASKRSSYYSDRDGVGLNVGDTVAILTKGKISHTKRGVIVGLDRGSFIRIQDDEGKEIIRYPRNVRKIPTADTS